MDGALMNALIAVLAFLVLAPIAGALLAGVDRIVSARMQGRVGPPLLQPYWDVRKLLMKRPIAVNSYQNYYLVCFLAFVIVTGALFFSGGDLLLTIFALTVAGVFLVLGAYSPNSPYSNIGAERELIQMMAYEPMLIVTALGFYSALKFEGGVGSFQVSQILNHPEPLLTLLPGIFFGFLFILTIKLRKSPFDLSTSHHGHQELVKGLTTEFSGPTLAILEIAHWYENVILMGFVYLFFAAWGPGVAIPAVAVVYLLEVLVDNAYARLTWKITLRWAWAVTLIFGAVNLVLLAQGR
jgi:ech hydrogenase subunit B